MRTVAGKGIAGVVIGKTAETLLRQLKIFHISHQTR